MEIVSVGPIEDGPDALGTELARVAQRLTGPRLGVVYLPVDADHRAFLRAAKAGLGGTVVGATTGGAAFTERGPSRTGAVAGVFAGAGLRFEVAVARGLRADPLASIGAATQKLVNAARRSVARTPAMLTLADAFACEGDALLNALESTTPPHWHHFGGTAGEGMSFDRQPFVFFDDEILTDAAVLVALFGETAPSLAVHHGWCAAEGGREFTVTSIDGSTLKTLDDRPAAEVYREELQRLGLLSDGDDLTTAFATFELGARTVYGELKIRAPIGVGADGSVRLASGLPRGTAVRVVTASPQELIEAARALSSRALEPFADRPVRGALVFDCAARLQRLGELYADETRAFLGGRSFPVVGLAGYGEIAKFGGSVEGFHNATAVMAAW